MGNVVRDRVQQLASALALAIALLGTSCASPEATMPTPSSTAINTPTSKPSLEASPPTASLTPAGLVFPHRPRRLVEYPAIIARFLGARAENEQHLADLFSSWQLPAQPDFAIVDADTDGDGEQELLLALPALGELDGRPDLGPVHTQVLMLFDSDTAGWRGYLLHPSADQYVYAGGPYTLPKVLTVGDVNKDGRPEVVFTTGDCGAHTCFTSVHFVAWDGQGYRPLTDKPPTMSYTDVSLADSDGDGVGELVMTGGTFGSAGAGLQRRRTEVYEWNGSTYALTRTINEPSAYLYHKIVDADDALKRGKYAEALELYQQAINDGELKAWKGLADTTEERRNLRAFARFRVALTHARVGDGVRLQAAVQESQRVDADHPFAQLSDVVQKAFSSTGSFDSTCQAVLEYARDHPELIEPMNGYGYANPNFAIQDLYPR